MADCTCVTLAKALAKRTATFREQNSRFFLTILGDSLTVTVHCWKCGDKALIWIGAGGRKERMTRTGVRHDLLIIMADKVL
jgi:hypothetical protein